MSEVKNTAKSATIYGIGLVINQIASFVMLPIYTRYLTPEDYGVIELLLMTINIVGVIAGVGISESIFRFFFKAETESRKAQVLFTAFALSSCFYCIASLFGFAFSGHLASHILMGRPEDVYAFRLIFIIFCLEPFQVIPLTLIRGQQKPLFYVVIVTVRLFIQLFLNILLVVYMQKGLFGILYSTLITQCLLGLFLGTYFFRFSGFSFSNTIARELIKYGSPLIIANVGNFVITFSDRYFLKIYADLSTVGIYSLGYKLGFVLVTIAVTPIFATWEPKRFEIVGNNDFQAVNNSLFLFFSFWVCFVALGIALFSRDLFRIMSAPEFVDAYKIVPLILAAYIFQAMTDFTNFGVFYSGNTRCLAVSGIVCACSIIVLSFLLIPSYKQYGAALATIITFAIRFSIIYFYAQKYFPLDLPWRRNLTILACGAVIYLLSWFFQREGHISSIAANSLWMACFLVAIFLAPIFSVSQKRIILKFVKAPLASMRGLHRG